MELKIDKFILTKVPGSPLFDLWESVVTKTGKTAGKTYKENIGYGISIGRVVEILVNQKVDLTKFDEDLEGLLKELTKITVKIGTQLTNLIKTT